VTGNVFQGVGKYGVAEIVKAKPTHAEFLQHELRYSDNRECLIAGVTPWRALMEPLKDDNAETFTALVDNKPVMMFGVVAKHDLVGTIWMLCSDEVDKHPKTFLKWSRPFVDYFQRQFLLLENVCPVEHYKTLTWLGYLDFMIMPTAIDLNGYKVLRFVRCQELEFMTPNEYTRPVIS
tara:strand:- start:534 stop:1067 length:534 start_codon:yes stop_codon:yes gene_type:complete